MRQNDKIPDESERKATRIRMQKELKAIQESVFNVPYHICDHFLGESHSFGHRIFVGSIFVFLGTCIAQIHVGIWICDILYEGGGFVVHAVGAVPFVEYAVSLKVKSQKDDKEV